MVQQHYIMLMRAHLCVQVKEEGGAPSGEAWLPPVCSVCIPLVLLESTRRLYLLVLDVPVPPPNPPPCPPSDK